MHVMKAPGGAEVQFSIFFIMAVAQVEWSSSHSSEFISKREPHNIH
jgi:hypothetical protein